MHALMDAAKVAGPKEKQALRAHAVDLHGKGPDGCVAAERFWGRVLLCTLCTCALLACMIHLSVQCVTEVCKV